jgi:tetratricopeptide (TPR) repeat protein
VTMHSLEWKQRLAAVIFILVTAATISGFSQESQEKLDFLYGERLTKEGLFDLAAIQFHRFLLDFPSSPRAVRAQWMAAESELRSGKFEEARTGYLRYILDYPSAPDHDLAQLKIGECLESQGLDIPAAQSYMQVYSIYPDGRWAGEGLFRNASIYLKSDSLSRAEAALRILLDLKNSPELTSKTTFMFADLFARQEKFDEAVRLLTPFLSRPTRDPDQVLAEYRLGLIEETVGDWEKAGKHYRSAALGAVQDSTSQSAWLKLGRLNAMLGDKAEAAVDFAKAGSLNIKASLTDQALFWQGRLESEGGRFQSALNAFGRIRVEAEPALHSEALFETARNLEALHRTPEAVSLYESLVNGAAVPVRKKSMLALAEAVCRSADFESSLKLYDRYVSEFPDDPNADRIRLRQSEIAFDSLGRPEDGFAALHELLKSMPKSGLLPKATLLYGVRLEEFGRMAEAASFYERIRRQFPFSDEAVTADMKLENPGWNGAKSGAGLAPLLSGLLKEFETGPRDRDIDFRIGMALFAAKDFPSAAVCLKRWIAAAADSERTAEAMNGIAVSYAGMPGSAQNDAMSDSADVYNRLLLSRFPSGPFAGRARIRLTLHALESGPNAHFADLRSLPHDTTAEFETLLYRTALIAVRRDSLESASVLLGRLSRDFPDGRRRPETLFLAASVETGAGRWNSADSLLSLADDRLRAPTARADIECMRGLIQSKKGAPADAVIRFESALNNGATVVAKDSLELALGNARLGSSDFDGAARIFEEALAADSAGAEARRLGLAPDFRSRRRTLLRGLAKAYSSMNASRKARKALILYGEDNPEPSERFFVWSSLSRLAESEGKRDQARFFLNKIIETYPSDSAMVLLGLMQYRQGLNDQAAETLTKALGAVSSPESRAMLQSKVICAMFRMDRLEEGSSRLKSFENQYKSLQGFKEMICGIEMERGRAFVRNKSFESALKSFEKVQDEKRSPLAPEADMETGRVLLLMNKTEKGMELLSGLPGKYPGHQVLPRVYLNLGDQYYRLNQVENALAAFKKAAADSSDFEVSSVATRYLIKIYEAIQMTDAAMALTRSYLRRFPDAEDALQKKIQIGIYYYELKEFDRALDRFRSLKTESDAESDAEIQYWIGKCYADMGQYERAILEYLKVKYVSPPARLPWAPTALYEAGVAYLRLHRPSSARQMFEKIVSSEGASSDLGRIARQKITDIDQGKAEAAL